MGRREPAPAIAPLHPKLVETEPLQRLELRLDRRGIDDAAVDEVDPDRKCIAFVVARIDLRLTLIGPETRRQ